jgi:hypothetical protein
MPGIAASALETRLSSLDVGARANFVAALATARGRDASASDGRVRIRTPTDDGTARVVWVARTGRLGRPRPVPDGVDAVVTAGSGVDAAAFDRPTVDAAALRRRALYAVDRDTARRLFRDHLGCAPDGPDAPTAPRTVRSRVRSVAARLRDGTDGGEGGDRAPSRSTGAAAVVVAVAVAVAVALALAVGGVPGVVPAAVGAPGAAGSVGGGEEATAAAGAASTPTARTPAARTPTARTPAVDGRTMAVAGASSLVAPGLTTRRVTDADRLAAAHADSLVGESYVWRATYREFDDGVEVASHRTVLRVANATHYVGRTVREGRPSAVPRPFNARDDVYAAGAVEFERAGDGGYEARPVGSAGAARARYEAQAARVIGWYLSSNASSVDPVDGAGARLVTVTGVDGRTRWALSTNATTIGGTPIGGDGRLARVDTEGDPYWGVSDASSRAVVGGGGRVHALYHSHDADHGDVRVVVSFRYEFRESVTVERPTWLDGIAPVRSEDGTAADGTDAARDRTR